MGKVIMSGIVPQLEEPVNGLLASKLAVGSSVYLNENGSPVEYLVVNQGIPSNSNLYDKSCDGTWLLRKNLYSTPRWGGGYNIYENCEHDTFFNGTFLALFDQSTQDTIVQAKIPYINGKGNEGSLASGSSGLSRKVFSLSTWELGFSTTINNWFKEDGAKLDYFLTHNGTEPNAKRAAYLNGTVTQWWTRSPYSANATQAGIVSPAGAVGDVSTINVVVNGVRPALILPFNAVFDKETLILKGVK